MQGNRKESSPTRGETVITAGHVLLTKRILFWEWMTRTDYCLIISILNSIYSATIFFNFNLIL